MFSKFKQHKKLAIGRSFLVHQPRETPISGCLEKKLLDLFFLL
jgi:hypothetical protein